MDHRSLRPKQRTGAEELGYDSGYHKTDVMRLRTAWMDERVREGTDADESHSSPSYSVETCFGNAAARLQEDEASISLSARSPRLRS